MAGLLAVLFLTVSPTNSAWAQYGGGPGPSPSPSPSPTPGANAQGRLAVNDTDVTPGQSISASGGGFNPGTTVSLFWLRLRPGEGPVSAGSVQADSNGGFTLAVTAPSQVGVYVLYAQGQGSHGGTLVLIAIVTVRIAGAPAEYQAVGLIARDPRAVEAQQATGAQIPPQVKEIHDRLQEVLFESSGALAEASPLPEGAAAPQVSPAAARSAAPAGDSGPGVFRLALALAVLLGIGLAVTGVLRRTRAGREVDSA